MNCHWTKKVSLLIDGELARSEDVREVESHLQACAACQSAREDFLLFRERIASYQPTPENLVAQREALKNILASGTAAVSSPLAGARAGRDTEKSARSPLRPFATWRGRIRGFFRLPSPRSPAAIATAALVLIAIASGLMFYLNARRTEPTLARRPASSHADRDGARGGASASDASGRESSPAQENQPVIAEAGKQAGGEVAEVEAMRDQRHHAPNIRNRRAEGRGRTGSLNIKREGGESARVERDPANRQPAPSRLAPEIETPIAADRTIAAITRFEREFPIDTDSKTARHVVQAQLLLRSFRNARLSDQSAAFDIAHEKQRSQKLLYQNIVLRRQATARGDLPVERVLSSLEPILIDIANLPDRPALGEVRSIKERMQRQNIVAMLQVSGAAVASLAH